MVVNSRRTVWAQEAVDRVIEMTARGRLRSDIAASVGRTPQAVSGLVIRLRRAGTIPQDQDAVPEEEETERKCLKCHRMFMSPLPKSHHRICDQHNTGVVSDWMDTAYGYSAAVG